MTNNMPKNGPAIRQQASPPRVVVSLHEDLALMQARVVERARDQGWRVQDLQFYGGGIPPGEPPQGAFLDGLSDDPLVTALQASGCHVVRLGRYPHPDDHLLPAVISDHPMAGRLAAEHFAERRFRNVGFVSYSITGESRDLFNPFVGRARELGCEFLHLVFRKLAGKEGSLPRTEKHRLRQREFAEWIQKVPKPIGLFTFSDNQAGRLSATILETGLAIPSQVAILGHGGNRAICVSSPVPLSAVDEGAEERAKTAVGLMQDLIDGKPKPSATVLVPPVGVVVRESTDVLAAADPVVAAAIRYMWDHLAVDLSVEDVAQAVSSPRRKLERGFKNAIGHGISHELRRRRLERCCELLRTTELSVTDIAPMVGFANKDYLHACFRRAYGMTPRKWRLEHAGGGWRRIG